MDISRTEPVFSSDAGKTRPVYKARLAVDIGGTFTDIALETPKGLATRKVLTTPQAPELGVIEGSRLVMEQVGLAFSELDVFVHGTTLATNAIIERRGAKTGLIATDGFRDTLTIGTESRFDQYDLNLVKPSVLVPRALRATVVERMDCDGNVLLPLEEESVRIAARTLGKQAVEAVAVSLIHAYANPSHEIRVREILVEELPGVPVSISSEVCPEVREYERASTTVTNAYVQPLMASYLGRLEEALHSFGFRGALYLVTSAGGLTTVDTARKFPVRLVESGPAGGAIFATEIAMVLDEPKVMAFDMGGTTAKVCLIEDFMPKTSRSFEVDRAARFRKGSGLPIRIPVIEMVEIGAGGGSIAHLDSLGRVSVGPESASSEPGPACYGRGGQRPAVTDADLTLGLLRAESFAGGTMSLDREASRAALASEVGKPLGLSPEMAAYAVHEVVCENMAGAARVHAVEQGEAASDHVMIAFGGAAPLHAARVAEKTGVERVVIPPNAGVGSAVGFLTAPVAFENVRSRRVRLDAMDAEAINTLLSEMEQEARALVEPGAGGMQVHVRRTAMMRYVGQGHELAVAFPGDLDLASDAGRLREDFETQYAAVFNRVIPAAAIEVLSWAVLVTTERPRSAKTQADMATGVPAPAGTQNFFDGETGQSTSVPFYWRRDISASDPIAGPALIVEDETTTFVTKNFNARADDNGCIIMERKA